MKNSDAVSSQPGTLDFMTTCKRARGNLVVYFFHLGFEKYPELFRYICF
jgi:hypothetical protein